MSLDVLILLATVSSVMILHCSDVSSGMVIGCGGGAYVTLIVVVDGGDGVGDAELSGILVMMMMFSSSHIGDKGSCGGDGVLNTSSSRGVVGDDGGGGDSSGVDGSDAGDGSYDGCGGGGDDDRSGNSGADRRLTFCRYNRTSFDSSGGFTTLRAVFLFNVNAVAAAATAAVLSSSSHEFLVIRRPTLIYIERKNNFVS